MHLSMRTPPHASSHPVHADTLERADATSPLDADTTARAVGADAAGHANTVPVVTDAPVGLDSDATALIRADTTARVDGHATAHVDGDTTTHGDSDATVRVGADATAHVDGHATARVDGDANGDATARVDIVEGLLNVVTSQWARRGVYSSLYMSSETLHE